MADVGKAETSSADGVKLPQNELIVPDEDKAGHSALDSAADPEDSHSVLPASPQEIVVATHAAAQVEANAPSQQDVASVREVVAQLFDVMGIKRVISVDDDYEGDLEELLGMASVAAATDQAASFADEFDLNEPEEVWQSNINGRWWSATETERHLLLARGKKQTGNSDPEDQLDASAVHQLVPGPDILEFLAWTPSDWDANKEDVVATAGIQPTLVLFDRNLGDRRDEGLRLAEDLFSMDAHSSIYIVILTRTVAKGDEPEAWREFSAAFPKLVPERLVIVSKGNLGPEPESFPRSIKIVLTTRFAALLKSVIKDAVDRGTEFASEEMAKLTPDEFEKMIIAASMKEGIWEPESLLRVFQVFMRKEVRSILYSSQELRKNANKARRLCAVGTLEPPETEAAIATQQAELYDFPEHLNSVHLPVELGDVFEAQPDVEFVLAEQPCDLMVRSEGERATEIFDAVLLPIRKDKPKQNRTHLAFELPFYYRDGSSAWVYFNRPRTAPMRALDMTVFNTDGRSVFNAKKPAPEGLWPAWEKRYERMARHLQSLQPTLEQIDKLSKDRVIDGSLRKKLVESLLQADASAGRRIKVTISGDGTVRYDIRRMRRILPMRARALLSRYALHKARDAFDFDLAVIAAEAISRAESV